MKNNRRAICFIGFFLFLIEASGTNFSVKEDQPIVSKLINRFLQQKGASLLTPPLADEFILKAGRQNEFLNLSYSFDAGKFQFDYEVARKIKQIEWRGLANADVSEAKEFANRYLNKVYREKSTEDLRKSLSDIFKEAGYELAQVKTLFNKATETLVIEVKLDRLTVIEKFSVDSPNRKLNERLQRLARGFLKKSLTTRVRAELATQLTQRIRQEGYLLSEVQIGGIQLIDKTSKAIVGLSVSNPYAISIQIKNQKMLRGSILDSEIKETLLASSEENLESELRNRLKSLYLDKGFSRVKVTSLMTETDTFKKLLTVTIEEGPRVKIKSIIIEGTVSREHVFYIDLLKKYGHENLKEGYYNFSQFESASQELIRALQNLGHLQARIVSQRVRYNDRKDEVTINLKIDEGPVTRISKIGVQGADAFQELELIEATGLKVGDPLKIEQLEESLNTLKQFYQDRGYLEMSFTHNDRDLLAYTDRDTQVEVKYQIYEGPRVEVQSIVVDGNDQTKEFVIRKELEFAEGDVLTPQLISDSIVRLQQLGLFSAVEIRTLEASSQISSRTVIIRVSERDPGLFNLGLGFSSQNDLSLRGFVGASYRNLQGKARTVSTRLEANSILTSDQQSFVENRLNFSYVEPYIFDTRTRGRFALNRSERLLETNNNFFIQNIEGLFSLEQFVTRRLQLIWEVYRLSSSITFNKDREQTSETDVIASTGPIVEYDRRNHRFNPTDGDFTRATLEYANPQLGGTPTIEFLRATAIHSQYIPLNESHSWSWASSLQLGFLENLSPIAGAGVPYSRKGFYLGGRTTLRGFAPRSGEQIPNEGDLGLAPGEEFYLTTQAISTIFKTEVRFPIYNSIGGAVFYDGGRLDIAGIQFANPWRDAVGVAMRIITPVGPINIELGYKLDRMIERGESPYQLHFSIGTF